MIKSCKKLSYSYTLRNYEMIDEFRDLSQSIRVA
jgi:hypothetical protein